MDIVLENITLLDIAKRAYFAYGEVTDFKNFRGDPMPRWDDLPDVIKFAWQAAAQSVLDK